MSIHTCSYYCERPECVLAQRDELRQKLEQAEKPVHTDHPVRHWDRTCPACVYESDISAERVDETAKDRHEPVAWLDGGLGVFYWACEFKDRPVPPGFEPLYAAYPRYWSNVTDDALIEEVRHRGFTIRDAQISPKKEWFGLTDEEVGGLTVFDGLTHIEVPILADFVRAIEAKLKEKNTCTYVN